MLSSTRFFCRARR